MDTNASAGAGASQQDIIRDTGPFLKALDGRAQKPPPVWMMRQAGRYLPEYRALRANAADFMAFCYNPAMAAEATLQPIRRFGFDAAIIFSDILVIPDALGQKVTFEAGEGPRLPPLETPADLARLADDLIPGRLDPVYEALQRVRAALDPQTALIGFCGAPWTIATYMIAGRGTPDQAPARLFAYRHREEFSRLIDLLARVCAQHLVRQIDAGAQAVQIFDSWAGVLPDGAFEAWSLAPIARIAKEVRASRPHARIIAFPRGASPARTAAMAGCEGIDCVGLDTAADLASVHAAVAPDKALQGNLDPLLLLAGGRELDEAVDRIVAALADRPHVFNLGHGILPPTPIPHVEAMLKRLRGG